MIKLLFPVITWYDITREQKMLEFCPTQYIIELCPTKELFAKRMVCYI